jgi:hypothetical protein
LLNNCSNFLHEYLRVAAILVTFNTVDAEAALPAITIYLSTVIYRPRQLISINIVPRCDALGDVVEVLCAGKASSDCAILAPRTGAACVVETD